MADGRALKVLFFGMTGTFSVPPLEALLQAGVDVCAVVVPAPGPVPVVPVVPRAPNGLPVLTPHAQHNAVHVAWDRGVPVYEVADLGSPEAVDLVRNLVPDAIAVACFDRLIPRRIREQAKLAVNVHPSLLPENRGPAPLYWMQRLGLRPGVTVHLLDNRADAGDILVQQEAHFANVLDSADIERALAELGGQLLVQTLTEFEAGTLRPRPQDESRATTYGWPAEAATY